MTAIKKSPEIESIISHEDMKQDTKIRCSGISPLKSDNHSAVQKSSLDIEKTKFFQAISKGVSLLIQQYGYSRARATSLILEEIRQDDDHPTEEEVFKAMQFLCLGMEDARKTVTVARAFKRSLDATKTSKEDAIRDLTSKLETSNLLNKVTRPNIISQEGQQRSLSDSVPDFKTLLNECKQKGPKEKEISSLHTKSNYRNVNNIQRSVKTKSRAVACTGKGQRKRHLPLDENNDVDAVVEKKAINLKEHSKSDISTSPPPGISRKRTSPEHQVQQPSKRPRCDSV